MSTPIYRQIIADVHRMCSTLSLQLPANKQAIAVQLRNLQKVRRSLQAIQAKTGLLTHRSWKLIRQDQYRQLNQLVSELVTEVTNMILLAEEFAADAEGSISCLRDVNYRKDVLIQQLITLIAQSHPKYKIVSAPLKTNQNMSIRQEKADEKAGVPFHPRS